MTKAEPALLLRNATIARSDAGRSAPARADILVRGQRIAAIERAGAVPDTAVDDTIDAGRLLVLPGMINGHLHSWDHFLKGCIENHPMELFMAKIRPRRPVPLTPRHIYLRTMIGAIESLHTGATTLIDDLSLGQVFSREHVEAALQAYEDGGTRALIGFSMIDKAVVDSFPFVEECFPAALTAELRALARPAADQLLGLCRELALSRHPAEQRVGVIISPSAPQRCTDDFLRACRRIADELDLPVMTHCQETRLQIVTGQEFWGESLVQHLHRLGFLKAKTALIHGTWLSKRDIELIARTGATVQINSWANMLTGSGVPPTRELLEQGVNLSMGTDGTGVPFTVSMLNTVGAAAVADKIRQPDYRRWLSAHEAFEAATAGGARALGLERGFGTLEVGKRADLVCYSLDATPLTPLNDPITQVVYGERGAAIDTVLVDGGIVMRGRRLTRIDETALLREAQWVHDEIKDAVTGSLRDSGPFYDAASRVYMKSLSCPLAHDNLPSWIEGNHIHPHA